jgi:hypothetical protein
VEFDLKPKAARGEHHQGARQLEAGRLVVPDLPQPQLRQQEVLQLLDVP